MNSGLDFIDEEYVVLCNLVIQYPGTKDSNVDMAGGPGEKEVAKDRENDHRERAN